jgi:DNA (cytosine-5)-methyltransferase 1
MSWLFSQVLVVEYLGENYLDGEQSVPLSGNNTQLAYCLPDKMTDYFKVSRFGMMFKPLTEQLGQELLMSYQAAFRAKTFPQQEKGQELTENGQECGKKWHGLFARYDPNTHLLKTVQCSLLEDLEQSLQIWPKWGSMQNGECFQQPMLVQTTLEKECGLLEKVPNNMDFFHTPNTTGLDGGSNSRKALKKRLTFPTPTFQSAGTGPMLNTLVTKNGNHPKQGERLYNPKTGKHIQITLNRAVNLWPTPDANCGMRGTQQTWLPIRPSGHPAQYSINQAVRDSDITVTGGKLNPTWVEWLMGWPLGWTDLKPLEMDKFHFVQQQHGTSLKED